MVLKIKKSRTDLVKQTMLGKETKGCLDRLMSYSVHQPLSLQVAYSDNERKAKVSR